MESISFIELLKNSDIDLWRKFLTRDNLKRLREPDQAARILGVGQKPVPMNENIMMAYNKMYAAQPNCHFQIGEHWLPKPWNQLKLSKTGLFPKNVRVYRANIPQLDRKFSSIENIPFKTVFVAPGTEEHENYSKLVRQIWGINPLGGTYELGRPKQLTRKEKKETSSRYTWITPDEKVCPQWRFDVKNAINTRLYNHLQSRGKKIPTVESPGWLKWRDRVLYEHPFALGFGTLPGVKEAHSNLPHLEDYYEIPETDYKYEQAASRKKPIEHKALDDFSLSLL